MPHLLDLTDMSFADGDCVDNNDDDDDDDDDGDENNNSDGDVDESERFSL